MGIIKKIVQLILAGFAKIVLLTKKPRIVGITGSVGKTGTKESIAAVVGKKYRMRASYGNFNNEFGLPYTILGIHEPKFFPLNFLQTIFAFLKSLLDKNYPEILILEYAADRPGDIEYLTNIARPNISVVTKVGSAHMEFFQAVEDLQLEKAQLVKALPKSGLAILNADDPRVLAMKRVSKAGVVSYGIAHDADVKGGDVMTQQVQDAHLKDPDQAISLRFTIQTSDGTVKCVLPGRVGLPVVYESLAAYAVAKALGISDKTYCEAMEGQKSAPGRLRLLSGIKDSILIDDSYNSSPEAATESLKALSNIKARRRLAVLGDMMELGTETERAHRKVGRLVRDLRLDYLVTVGPRAKFIADEARNYGFAKTKIWEFENVFEAGLKVQNLIKEGDVILIKGSQAVRLEKIVKEVMGQPDRAGELLCRQSKKWLEA